MGLRRAVRGLRLRHVRLLVAVVLVPFVLLSAAALLTPLPAALQKGAAYTESTRYLDRDGRVLRETRANDATRARWVSLRDTGPHLPRAVVAAEDARFYDHPGVDPLSVLRALGSDIVNRRVVSGASTLTMQLARNVAPHPRTLRGKLGEMAMAMRIEGSLHKDQILEQYMNRAPFGVGVRGVSAASYRYFDKPPSELSLAEAATLASIPRGPAVYDIEKHPERVLRRRNRVLARMRSQGLISEEERASAESEPLTPQLGRPQSGAPHFTVALESGALGPVSARANGMAVSTTLDRDLQREVENVVREALQPLARKDVSAASVVVLSNATGDILAYLGSPEFTDPRGGQNDGVRARRQPGSTLKPFIYGLLMERRDATPATVFPDLELHLADGSGTYAPNNYDGRFHGPVRMREALGNSYNVPAVLAAHQVGPGPVVERLRALGLGTLDLPAEHYGDAIALGDGEVRLIDLTNAYATLARGGVALPVRAVRTESVPEPVRVLPAWEASLVTDMLSDRSARIASFGEASVLDLPFAVAAKTGTSKGFHDNWTMGYTKEITVGVWVGNFDGSPMHGVSGITGAGPIFQGVMSAAMRGRTPVALGASDETMEIEVCPLSGKRAGPHCHHHVREVVRRGTDVGECDMHQEVAIDTRNGLRALPSCGADFVERRELVSLPDEYRSWAKGAGVLLVPEETSPLCSGGGGGNGGKAPRIRYPLDGSRFQIEKGRPLSSQMLPITVDSDADARVLVDGRALSEVGARVFWTLAPGDHEIVAEARGGGRSQSVHVRVD
jgi:penicillin-binding protein 1C